MLLALNAQAAPPAENRYRDHQHEWDRVRDQYISRSQRALSSAPRQCRTDSYREGQPAEHQA